MSGGYLTVHSHCACRHAFNRRRFYRAALPRVRRVLPIVTHPQVGSFSSSASRSLARPATEYRRLCAVGRWRISRARSRSPPQHRTRSAVLYRHIVYTRNSCMQQHFVRESCKITSNLARACVRSFISAPSRRHRGGGAHHRQSTQQHFLFLHSFVRSNRIYV